MKRHVAPPEPARAVCVLQAQSEKNIKCVFCITTFANRNLVFRRATLRFAFATRPLDAPLLEPKPFTFQCLPLLSSTICAAFAFAQRDPTPRQRSFPFLETVLPSHILRSSAALPHPKHFGRDKVTRRHGSGGNRSEKDEEQKCRKSRLCINCV